MPCIIKTHVQHSSFLAYCGKPILGTGKAFRTTAEAVELRERNGASICVKCRKAAGIPPKETTPKTVFEPFTSYVVSAGRISELKIVAKTATQYRCKSGELVRMGKQSRRVEHLRRTGASAIFIFANLEEAKAKAREQQSVLEAYYKEQLSQLEKSMKELDSWV